MIRPAVFILILLLTTGCSSWFSDHRYQRNNASSLVDFLYPDGEHEVTKPAIPARLQLPLRVGLAVVPNRSGGGMLSAGEETELLNGLAETFRTRPYIEHIEVVPRQYLRQGGFDSLRQVGRLFDLDAMALVSYDQLIRHEERALSLLYVTIVGAYVLPGTENRVNTFVDTTVFDLASGTLLFRAPGIDHDKALSTGAGARYRGDRIGHASFRRAFGDMSEQLDSELDHFQQRVKDGHTDVAVTYREGYGGTGGVDWWVMGMLLLLLLGQAAYRHER